MLNIESLGLKDFNYKEYIVENSLDKILGLKALPKNITKLIKSKLLS